MNKKKLLNTLLFFLIIGLGLGIYFLLKSARINPEQVPVLKPPTVVEVIKVSPVEEQVKITAMGVVVPAKSVTVYPEVSGRIIYQSPQLAPGGRIRRGNTIVRIDPQEYDLAIRQQRASVAQARQKEATERGLKTVAEEEWRLTSEEVRPTGEGKRLALHDIQLESAQFALDAAQSGLDKAQLLRKRTVIRAPFDALVTEEFVDLGQVVSPGSRIATLVGTDKYWVRVSVPADRLRWISIPDVSGERGSPVTVVYQLASDLKVERRGRVIKLMGDLEPKGKMARLLVEIDDPLGTKTKGKQPRIPVFLGAYVHVEIEGQRVADVIVLPRSALRDQNRVWIKSEENKLEFRRIDVVWARTDTVLARGDIRTGEQIITNRVSTPVEGLSVMTEKERKNRHGQ